MYKYQQSYKSSMHGHNPPVDAHWNGADGEDVVKAFVNKRDHNSDYPGIEQQISRTLTAIGMLADKLGVDLLEVFDADDLDDFFRINQEKE